MSAEILLSTFLSFVVSLSQVVCSDWVRGSKGQQLSSRTSLYKKKCICLHTELEFGSIAAQNTVQQTTAELTQFYSYIGQNFLAIVECQKTTRIPPERARSEITSLQQPQLHNQTTPLTAHTSQLHTSPKYCLPRTLFSKSHPNSK